MDDRSPHEFENGAVDDRVIELCRRGLEKFRQGDVAEALVDWNRARGLDPNASQPKLYIERAAHGLDPESGDVPSGLPPLGAEPLDDDGDEGYLEVELTSGGPSPAEDEFLQAAEVVFALNEVDAGWSLDDEDASTGVAVPVAGADAPAVSAGVMGVPDEAVFDDEQPAAPDSAEDGAELELAPAGDEQAAALEPAPGSGAGVGIDDLELAPPGAALGEEVPYFSSETPTADLARPAELDLELGGAPAVHDSDSEITVPGGTSDGIGEPVGLSDDALEALGGAEPEERAPEDTTVERPGVVKRGFALPDLDQLDEALTRQDDRHEDEVALPEIDFRGAGLDDELTVERRGMASMRRPGGDDELTVERRAGTISDDETIERGAAAIGDDDLTRERRPDDPSFGGPAVSLGPDPLPMTGDWDATCEQMREQVAGTLPEAEGEERVRHWVGAFIDRARLELDRGEPALAVTALELALSEQPQSVVAQKLIHRHKELLIEIYRAYLDDPSRVPAVAVPMHELSAHTLDNRAAFLLSRIDGTFSIEEILDVSGMPDIETYRHLCKLLLKGILELR